jgi:hypothetical protein
MSVPFIISGAGGGTNLTGTGIARDTGACTELSGDVTTSGSNAASVVKVNGAAVPASTVVVGTNSSRQIIAVPNQTANNVFAGPTTGVPAAPGFRALVAADIPNIAESQVTNLTTDLAAKQATLTGTGLARNSGACTELSGDVTTSGSNATTLKNTGTAGTYTKVTTDAQGRVSSGALLGYADLPTTGGGVVTYIEDFISNPGSSITVSAASGNRWDTSLSYAPVGGGTTGTITSNQNGTFLNPGIVTITTPATSGNGVCLTGTTSSNSAGSNTIGVLGSNAPWQVDIWFKLPATITNYCVRAGVVVTSTNADPPADGYWIEYDTANANSNSVFTLRCNKVSVATYVVTSVTPVANTWYHVLISSSVAGTVAAQISTSNGALTSAVTSSSVSTAVTPGVGVQVIARTTAAAILTVDRMTYSASTGRA